MALGPYPLISLVLAREKQADIRRLILEGINPAEHKKRVLRYFELYVFPTNGSCDITKILNLQAPILH